MTNTPIQTIKPDALFPQRKRHPLPLALVVLIPFAIFAGYMMWFAYVSYSIPLNDCAREHNVYRCQYVPQPVNPTLLPPPTEEK